MADTSARQGAGPSEAAPAARDADAIYQEGRVVARVTNAVIDTPAREIRFEELWQSEELLLPDDCEFREYRIMVQKVDDATKVQRGAAHRGRVLRGVTAEILGHRTQ